MKWILSLGALAAWCTTAGAGVGEWTSAGISGGSVQRVEYVRDGVALAVTNGGIYRTTNHGASWTKVRASGGLHLPLASIAVNRVNPDEVLATDAFLLRSPSGGAAFIFVTLPNVAFGPSMSVGFSHDGAYAWVIDSTGIVRRSADAGVTWTRLNATVPPNHYYWVEPDVTDRNTVYAASGMGVLISRDAGETWTAPAGASRNYAITPSRTTSGTALAIDTSGGFYIARSTDFGATWTPSTNGPQNTFRLATAPGARAVAVDYDAVVHTSVNDGQTWTTRGRLPNGETTWLSIDPANPDRVLGATPAGIVGSNDGGLTWEERNQGILDAWAVDVAVGHDASNAVYVATADLSSIYRRDPASGAFTGVGRASTPLLGYPGYRRWGGKYSIAAAPQDGRRLYMLRDGSYGRSIDGGANWTHLSTPGPANVLGLDPVNPLVAYIGGADANFKTIDGGSTWTPIAGGLPVGVTRFLVDPANNATVYATLSRYQGATVPVYKSLDGGANWAPAGWSGSNVVEPVAIVFEPGRSSTIYLALHEGLYKSTDSAASWTRLEPVLGFPQAGFYDVVVDPQSPSVVYAASFGGLVRSADAGATWGAVIADPVLSAIYGMERIALVPGHNARLIGLQSGGGVYELDAAARLVLSHTPAALTAGESGTITLTARNDGTFAATRVRLISSLPAATGAYSVQATGATCAVVVRELSCDIGNLPPASPVTVSVGFTPAIPGVVSFALTAYEPLAASAGAQATANVNSAASPVSSGGRGGGGGGRLDYLLLALLGALQLRGALKKH